MRLFFRRGTPRAVVFERRSSRSGVIRRLAAGATACALIIGATAFTLSEYRSARPSEDTTVYAPVVVPGDEDGAVYERRASRTTPSPTPGQTPAPVAVGAAAPLAAAPPRDVPYRLVIEKIGVNAPVATYGLGNDAVPDVPASGREVAWYNFSARPGSNGNAVLAGHVTWSGRAVFYSLDKLTGGDKIIITDHNGGRFTYTVSDVFLVNADDPSGVSVMHPTDTNVVTLITCGGAPYYVGGSAGYDYTHRLIVRGNLTESFTATTQTGG